MENGSEIRFEGCGAIAKNLREEANMTVREMARIVDCDPGRISKIENNQLSLSLTTIEKIAVALGVEPEAIILMCFEQRFPQLHRTKGGKLIAKFLTEE